jgi:Calcium/calmodulin dependent protein kinase II association domain
MSDNEIIDFLFKHLQSIRENDTATYNETTSADLTLYEWWVTPHRIDGLPFHEFMMQSNASRGTFFGAEEGKGKSSRIDLANLHIQRYSDTAIASYTLLASTSDADGVKVAAHNESRVMVKMDGKWKVVHVHKSPAYPAPHVQDQ